MSSKRSSRTGQGRTGTLKRPKPETWGARLVHHLKTFRDRLFEAQTLWLVIFLAAGTWTLVPRSGYDDLDPRDWLPGSIAPRDLVAPVDFPVEDKTTTEEKQRRAREEVLPIYDVDSARGEELGRQLGAVFAEGRRLLSSAPVAAEGGDDPLAAEVFEAALQAASELRMEGPEVRLLTRLEFSPELEDRLRGALDSLYRRGVVSSKELLLENRLRGVTLRDVTTGAERHHVDLYGHLDYPEEARSFLVSEARRWPGYGVKARNQLVDLLFRNVAPNLNPNQSDTRARRQAAASATPTVFTQVLEGQVLLRRGDTVTPFAARAVEEIARLRAPRGHLLPILGTFLLLSLSALFVWSGIKGEKVADHSRQRRFNESLALLLVAIFGTQIFCLLAQGLAATLAAAPFNSLQSYAFAIPYAVLAVVARLLYTRNAALVLSLVFSVLVLRMAPVEGPWLMIYCLGGSLTAIAVLDVLSFKQRLAMIRVGSLVGIVNLALILVITALAPGAEDRALLQTGFDLLCGFSGGLILAGVASFAVPVLESVFQLTTDIKLVELSNTNLPLLRRLAFEAPGSFQHSLMVANLAKAGCEAIEADAVLAYAGALYHDVGKIERPEYFIENQGRGRNPHDKIQPSMSALVIINHVKKGLSLAREYNLPQPLMDAIAQHHGTRRLTFFYKKAKEKSSEGEVFEDDYRYPGPKPSNKVMGVLMLADGVEAASRSLDEPTDLKIRSVVERIVDDCLQEGQLDESDLTLADIRKVSEAFHRILSNIYHRRIDYPGFDFNRRPKREKKDAEGSSEEAPEETPPSPPPASDVPRAVKAS